MRNNWVTPHNRASVGQTHRVKRPVHLTQVAHLVVVLCLIAAACTSTNNPTAEGSLGASGGDQSGASGGLSEDESPDNNQNSSGTAVPPLNRVTLDIQRSFGQLTLRSLAPGSEVGVIPADADPHDPVALIALTKVSTAGTALLTDLPRGPLKVLIFEDGAPVADGGNLLIPGTEPPAASMYRDQDLKAGFGYIETRDGTTLSAYVTLPPGNGPFPTLVEYSGYSPSNPGAQGDPGRLLIPQLGYALVQVNVRGTGCSGGSYDGFSRLEALDGYDVIETVAAQPWSAGVGMYGVSYPGIMQLFVAATQPPSLKAIAPLSVIDRAESVMYPGGIYNNGFGETWNQQVGEGAAPNGHPWVRNKAESGDAECADNQQLRIHNRDFVALARATPFRNELSEQKSPITFASQIEVPVYLAGAWQDEQTGGHFPALIDELENAAVLRTTLYNGLHIDPLGPQVLGPLLEFYSLYVADRPLALTSFQRALLGAGTTTFFGGPIDLPEVEAGRSLVEARRDFEAQDPIRVLFELGATAPNLPVANFEASFEEWPPAEVDPIRLFLAGRDRLSVTTPRSEATAAFTTSPDEGAVLTAPDIGAIWTSTPGWDWPRQPTANAATFTSPSFTAEAVMVGPASADLTITLPDATDADLEVTLSEISPDGSETFIQAGVLRLSKRAIDPSSTEIWPRYTFAEADASALVPGQPTPVRIEFLPFAHVIRPGSAVRLTVDTPGASRASWAFEVLPEPIAVEIMVGGDQPSSIVLPLISGVDAPDERPECGSLRGQPCRPAG